MKINPRNDLCRRRHYSDLLHVHIFQCVSIFMKTHRKTKKNKRKRKKNTSKNVLLRSEITN